MQKKIKISYLDQFEFKPTGEPEKQQSDPVDTSHDVFISALTDRLNRRYGNSQRGGDRRRHKLIKRDK